VIVASASYFHGLITHETTQVDRVFGADVSTCVVHHTLHNAVGTTSVLCNVLQIQLEIGQDGFHFLGIIVLNRLVQLFKQFAAQLRKVIDEVERILDLVGNAGR